MQRASVFLLSFLFLPVLILSPFNTHAAVEWSVIKQLELDKGPLGMVMSPDGEKLYVLVKGEVRIYSPVDGKLSDKIPVDKAMDAIAFSPKNEALILSSSGSGVVQFVRLEFTFSIDVTGRPFKGPENAPVTVAVFSDYQ